MLSLAGAPGVRIGLAGKAHRLLRFCRRLDFHPNGLAAAQDGLQLHVRQITRQISGLVAVAPLLDPHLALIGKQPHARRKCLFTRQAPARAHTHHLPLEDSKGGGVPADAAAVLLDAALLHGFDF